MQSLKDGIQSKLAPILLVCFLGMGYTATLLPGIGVNGDVAKFQFVGRYLGTPHATGYPTYIFINHIFTRLFPFGSTAYKANLLSAIFTIAAAVLLFRILRGMQVHPFIAFSVALGFGFTPTLWENAIIAEVYALHILFMTATIFYFIRWFDTKRSTDFLVGCAVYAFAFGNHLTSLWMLPAIVYAVWKVEKKIVIRPKMVLWVAAFILLSALQYTYFVWRTFDPTTVYLEMRANSLKQFIWFVTGAQFKTAFLDFGPIALLTERIPMFWGFLKDQYGFWLIPAVVAVFHRKYRPQKIFVIVYFLANMAYALEYGIPDIEPYFIPNYLVVAVLLGLGLHVLIEAMPPKLKTASILLTILFPLALFLTNYAAVDQHDNVVQERQTREILEAVGQDALIFVPDYNVYEYLMYYRIAEGWSEKDIYLIHKSLDTHGLNDLKSSLEEGQEMVGAPLPVEVYVAGVPSGQLAAAQDAGLTLEDLTSGLVFRVSR
jgi:hypothetical protein